MAKKQFSEMEIQKVLDKAIPILVIPASFIHVVVYYAYRIDIFGMPKLIRLLYGSNICKIILVDALIPLSLVLGSFIGLYIFIKWMEYAGDLNLTHFSRHLRLRHFKPAFIAIFIIILLEFYEVLL